MAVFPCALSSACSFGMFCGLTRMPGNRGTPGSCLIWTCPRELSCLVSSWCPCCPGSNVERAATPHVGQVKLEQDLKNILWLLFFLNQGKGNVFRKLKLHPVPDSTRERTLLLWLSLKVNKPGWPVGECPASLPAVFWAGGQDWSPPVHS